MEQSQSLKLQKLYELYERPMYRIAYAVLHDAEFAEDAVHDAFVRLVSRLGKIDEPDSPRTKGYIVKVIKSTSISIYRRNKRKYLFEQPIDDDTMKVPDTITNVESDAMRRSLLNGMNSTERRIVSLRCEYGLSWKEVAEKTGLNEGAVRKRFERIKQKLRNSRGEIYDET